MSKHTSKSSSKYESDLSYTDEPSSSPSSNPSDDLSQPSESLKDQSCPIKWRWDNHHGQNHRHWRTSSSLESNIKLIPPKEYDGSVDIRAYHRFIQDNDVYLRDGKVKGRWKVFLLSYYLTGKAYDFYTQKVAKNEEEWMVPEFYMALLNYCFPVKWMHWVWLKKI